MKLYHGTNWKSGVNIMIEGIDLSKSQDFLDFGKGFYLTPDRKKAEQWAKRKTMRFNARSKKLDFPCIVTVYIDEDKLNHLKCKKFKMCDKEWAEFVVYNRFSLKKLEEHGIVNHNKDGKYDAVIGEIADGSVSKVTLKARNESKILSEVSLDLVTTNNGESMGRQISLHTLNALFCIVSMECDIIKEPNQKEKLDIEKRRRQKYGSNNSERV